VLYRLENNLIKGDAVTSMMVDDVYTACARFEKLGVDFVKKPDDG